MQGGQQHRRLNLSCIVWAVGVVAVVCFTCVAGLLLSSSVGLVRSVALTQADLSRGEVNAWTQDDVRQWLNVTALCALAPHFAEVTGRDLMEGSAKDLVALVSETPLAPTAACGDGVCPALGPCHEEVAQPRLLGDEVLQEAMVAFSVWHHNLKDGILPLHPIRATVDYWTVFRDHPIAFVFLGFAAFEFPRLLLFLYLLGDVFPEALLPLKPSMLELLPLPTLGHPLFLPTLAYLTNPHVSIFFIGRAMFPTSPEGWLLSLVLRSFSWCMLLRGMLNYFLWGNLLRAPRLDDGHNVPESMAWTHTLSSRELKALGWVSFAFLKFIFFSVLTVGVYTGDRFLRPLLVTLHVSCTHWFVVFAHLIFALCSLPFVATVWHMVCGSRSVYTPSPFVFFNGLADHVVRQYWFALKLLCNMSSALSASVSAATDLLQGRRTSATSIPPPTPQWMTEDASGEAGYPRHLFADLPRSIAEELTCPVCCEVVRHAVAVAHCGHLFCHACLRQVLSHSPHCPVCRVQFDINGVSCALAIRRMLLGVEVPCSAGEGVPASPMRSPARLAAGVRRCRWRGPLQSLETHTHVFGDESEDGEGGDGGGGSGKAEPPVVTLPESPVESQVPAVALEPEPPSPEQ